jgi:hypothetical protein
MFSLSDPIVFVDLDAIVDWQTGVKEAWKRHFERQVDAVSPPPSSSSDTFQTLPELCDLSITTNLSNRSRNFSEDSSACEASSCDETVENTLASSESASTFQVGSGKSLDETSCELEFEAPHMTKCAFEGEEMKSDYSFRSPHIHPSQSTWNMCALENNPDAPFMPDPKKEYTLLDSAANHHYLAATSNLEPILNWAPAVTSANASKRMFEVPEICLEKRHGIIHCTPQNHSIVLEHIIHQLHSFVSFPARPGALDALNEMVCHGINVRLHFPPLLPNAQEGLEWVRAHLGQTWLDRVVLADSRCSVRFDLRIDDKCPDESATGETYPQKHILLLTPYNDDISKSFQHVLHWSQWKDVILPLLRKSPVSHSLHLSQNSTPSLRAASAPDSLASGLDHSPQAASRIEFKFDLNSNIESPILHSEIPQEGLNSEHKAGESQNVYSEHKAGESQNAEEMRWAAFADCFKGFQPAENLRALLPSKSTSAAPEMPKRLAPSIEPHEPILESCGEQNSSDRKSTLDAQADESGMPSDIEDCCLKTKGFRKMCQKCYYQEICNGGICQLEPDSDNDSMESPFREENESSKNCIVKELLIAKRRAGLISERGKSNNFAKSQMNSFGCARSKDVPQFSNPSPFQLNPSENEFSGSELG